MSTRLPIAVLIGLAIGLGACGGDDEAVTEPDTEIPAQTADQGRELFSASCSGCHTLSAADASGVVGPNLDEMKPDAARVLTAIAEGPGSMPAGLLDGEQAQAVAEYVEANAGE